jgi:hypothetical protein
MSEENVLIRVTLRAESVVPEVHKLVDLDCHLSLTPEELWAVQSISRKLALLVRGMDLTIR